MLLVPKIWINERISRFFQKKDTPSVYFGFWMSVNSYSRQYKSERERFLRETKSF